MNNPVGLQLMWNGKDKIINHHNEVPFKILKEISSKSFRNNDKNSTDNIIIRGDNLEGLKALKPYYSNSIKVIYIDPPYNTGMRQGTTGWIFSDRVDAPEIKKWFNKAVGAEHEDYSRHTKWLCMMYPRLKLLHELLSRSGIIFISIDDNEVHHLRSIMNEIFGSENFLAELTWKGMHTVRNSSKDFNQNTEYMLVYAKDKSSLIKAGNLKTYLRIPADKAENYPRDDHNGKGPYKLDPLHARNYYTPYKYTFKNGKKWEAPEGNYPRYSKETLRRMEGAGEIVFSGKAPKAKRYLQRVQEGVPPSTLLPSEIVGFNKDGTSELARLFNGKKVFDQPKPVSLIKYLLSISRAVDKKEDDYIVLDSFAGSGTTGHAVLKLNKEDKKKRRFILIQLDEGKEGEKVNVCDKVTAERIRRVIKGYSYKDNDKKNIRGEGLGGGFRYYEVNGTLKDEKGFINSLLSKDDLARLILFMETKESKFKLPKLNGNYKIGEKHNVIFYFVHDKKAMLDNDFLDKINYEKLKKEGRFVVVYAYGTLLDDEYLEENRGNLRFMHIPNDLDKIARI